MQELNLRPARITVVQGCDDLCEMCPNNICGSCTSLEKVTLMDNAVLGACNLTYGDNISWIELARKAQKQIFETVEFNNICTCCQWFELCRSTEVYYE